VPQKDKFNEEDIKVLDKFLSNYDQLILLIDNQNINSYINFIVDQLFAANKYFNDQEPWKKKNDIKRLNTIVYVSLELIRKITIMLYPIIPKTSLKVLKIFWINENEITFKSIINNEFLKPNTKIDKLEILFKKIINND
jgi:methionyl-tRNA synthetase